MRNGYNEQAAGDKGWRDPPTPLASTTADPDLDLISGPDKAWIERTAHAYLSGSVTLDQLYRHTHDLLAYRVEGYAKSEAERNLDLSFRFTDWLFSMTLDAIIHNDETDLCEYMPEWIAELNSG